METSKQRAAKVERLRKQLKGPRPRIRSVGQTGTSAGAGESEGGGGFLEDLEDIFDSLNAPVIFMVNPELIAPVGSPLGRPLYSGRPIA